MLVRNSWDRQDANLVVSSSGLDVGTESSGAKQKGLRNDRVVVVFGVVAKKWHEYAKQQARVCAACMSKLGLLADQRCVSWEVVFQESLTAISNFFAGKREGRTKYEHNNTCRFAVCYGGRSVASFGALFRLVLQGYWLQIERFEAHVKFAVLRCVVLRACRL